MMSLFQLLLKRMSVSEKVAKYKVERGMPVLNSEREQQILDDVAKKCGKQGETIKPYLPLRWTLQELYSIK